MRTREPEGPLDPQIAAELDVVDRVLGGVAVDPADQTLAELAEPLRDERPNPDEGWADGLDERAAAGFPRGGGRGPQGPKGRKSSWFSAGGWMVPAGAVATLAVVVVVATSNLGGSSDTATSGSPTAAVTPSRATKPKARSPRPRPTSPPIRAAPAQQPTWPTRRK